MKRSFFAVLLWGCAVAADAQTTTTYVFTAVDAVRVESNYLYVTGVVQGEAAAREVGFIFSASYVSQRESCERLILLAITKPGQYHVSLQPYGGSFAKCALARVTP